MKKYRTFDKIASKYHETDSSILKKYVTTPTVSKILGNVRRKSILEIGCGSGYFCRLLRKKGALVEGIDESSVQIDLAKSLETRSNLKKTFHVLQANNIDELEKEFDIIIAIFVLNYVTTKKEIISIISKIHRKLKKDGLFLGINVNPDIKLPYTSKYGRTVVTNKKCTKLINNQKFKVTFFNEKQEQLFDVNCTNWDNDTLIQIFEKAGFTLKWNKPFISKYGFKEFGENFWKEFSNNPYFVLFECKK